MLVWGSLRLGPISISWVGDQVVIDKKKLQNCDARHLRPTFLKKTVLVSVAARSVMSDIDPAD